MNLSLMIPIIVNYFNFRINQFFRLFNQESDFETIIQNIEDYLNSFLPFKVKYHRSCIIKTYSITFEVEYGENEELTENICALIEQLLSEHFPNGGYFVTSGYEYN